MTTSFDNRLYFDIETGSINDLVHADVDPYPPFNPDNVKLGNLKDPEKIDTKMLKAAEDHKRSEKAYIDKAFEKSALDPLVSRVLTIGYISKDTPPIILPPDMSEEEILNDFWTRCISTEDYKTRGFRIIGWSIHSFDLPFLYTRSLINGVTVPDGLIKVSHQRGYWSSRFIDLQKEITAYQYGKYASLQRTARAFNVAQDRSKECSGADFQYHWEDAYEHNNHQMAVMHLENDLLETRAIGERLIK